MSSSRWPLFREVFDGVARSYPAIGARHHYVDAMALDLVRRPWDFDVLVTENMFGDILSDEAAILTGSIGNLPSASLAARRQDGTQFGLYEPISGSAPDIAGKGTANPIAAILSAALLLRFSVDDKAAATRIENAVQRAIESGARTADLAASGETALSTATFTKRVLEHC
jgi:3-isopropylmalate dehydrogenase